MLRLEVPCRLPLLGNSRRDLPELLHTIEPHQIYRSSFDVDHDCDPLGIQSATGVLFRVTQESHEYTFVAKGTIDEYRERLRYGAEHTAKYGLAEALRLLSTWEH